MSFSVLHDLHLHTHLSSCCADPSMTPQNLAESAAAKGYDTLCLTDHLWDSAVPGPNPWYAPQDIDHVRQSLPLPQINGLRMVFGCELEYCGGKKLSLAPENYHYFDWLVIAVNHFHMEGLTRPPEVDSPQDRAALFTERLEQLLALDLPWKRVGLAHFTTGLLHRAQDVREVLSRLDRPRLKQIFQEMARRGMGIELNYGCMLGGLQDPDGLFWPYLLAKEAGCKFYCASDAHAMDKFDTNTSVQAKAVEALGLTKEDQFVLE